MKLSPRVKQLALLAAAVALGAGMPLFAASAAGSPPGAAAKPAVPGLQPPKVMSTGFTLVAPAANVQLNPGGSVTVTWTGGDPAWKVNLSLVDVDAWAVATSVASSISNGSPSFSWTFPASLPCNRRYEFYVAEVTNITWTYGPVFRLKCDVKVVKQHVGSTYVVRLVNGAYPIVPLISPASQQTRSVPIFSVTDAVPAGITITGGGGSGPGTWTPTTVSAVGPASLALKFTLNTQTTIAPGGLIAQYNLGAITPKNCASEAMSVSDALTGGTITALGDVAPANNTAICAP